MVEIICHRGLWSSKKQQNSIEAVAKALEFFDGVETDLRSYNGRIVLAHDSPGPRAGRGFNKRSVPTLHDLLKIYRVCKDKKILALNVKEDGLMDLLKSELMNVDFSSSKGRVFLFDMSGPESNLYLKHRLHIFNRYSEYESPSFISSRCRGSVLDSFSGKLDQLYEQYQNQRSKSTMIISPELHGRPWGRFWKFLKSKSANLQWRGAQKRNWLGLCTDFPDQAREYFK